MLGMLGKPDKGNMQSMGKRDAGRYLLVIYAPKRNQRIRVVTARDMTPREKRRFRTR